MGSVDCVQLFQVLVKSMGAKKCLEVGCFTGYTSLSLAQAIPSDGVVFTTDLNREQVGFVIFERANVSHKV